MRKHQRITGNGNTDERNVAKYSDGEKIDSRQKQKNDAEMLARIVYGFYLDEKDRKIKLGHNNANHAKRT